MKPANNLANIHVVDVDAGDKTPTEAPRLFFEGVVHDGGSLPFDPAPDGRVLVRLPVDESGGAGQLRVVENWFEEVKRLAPREEPSAN